MVSYFNQDITFKFINKRVCSNWIKNVITEETMANPKRVGDISVIFCSDEYLLQVNRQFLSHDYYTDVITFDNSDDKVVSGDIFISIDTVKSNADFYKQIFNDELHRVIIHGILHLLGYKDKSSKQKVMMTNKEDYYLAKRTI
jgi:rRNA maturation RNase YbeY